MVKNNIKKQLSEFNLLYKRLDDAYRGATGHYGLSECAFWILYTLRQADQPMTQTQICAMALYPRQTVNSALKKLERDGYLRLEHTNNRKSKEISFTPKGDALCRGSADRMIAAECRAFGGMTDKERKDFLRLYEKLIFHIEGELKALR